MFGHNEKVGRKWFANQKPDHLTVTSRFYTLQGEGPFSGYPATFLRLTKCNLACSFCFVGTTKILMGNGTQKNIKDVAVGDVVMSWNGQAFEPKPVTRVFKSEANRITRVQTSTSKKIWCTPEHPFLTSTRGWVPAESLTTDDVIVNWTSSDRMKMFNPVKQPDYQRPSITKQQREISSKRLQALWQDPAFRALNVERMTGDTNPMKDPAIALKGFQTRKDQQKTGYEQRFEKICEGLPIRYIGDRQGETIAHRVPDFIVEGQNKVIEIWAADALWSKDRDEQWIAKRKALFEKHGFETLFIPIMQEDLKIDNHHLMREKVAQFIHNGARVTNVIQEVNQNALVRLFGTKDSPKTVYNLEVADNHTYIAESMVVHNCDTFFDKGDELSFDQIFEQLDNVEDQFLTERGEQRPEWSKLMPRPEYGSGYYDRKHIALIITGGEPSLQTNLVPFLERALEIYAHVQIESNGILPLDYPDGVTLVVSPKCMEKDGVATRYLKPNQAILDRADYLKFVVCAPGDPKFDLYKSIPDWAFHWAETDGRIRSQIFISPMNMYNDLPQQAKALRQSNKQIDIGERSTVDEVISFWEPGLLDVEANQRNHEYAARYAIANGLRFQLQTHLYAGLA